jgi:uncharacterized protein (DUF1499 family)
MRSLLVLIGFILAVLSGLAAFLSGFGSRWDWWHFRTGFVILRWAAYGGIAAALVSAAGVMVTRRGLMRPGFILSVCGLLIGIVVFGIPLSWWQIAKKVPLIHDITTDTENPPGFVSILPLRKEAPNPAEYGGSDIAAQQRRAYPDLAPVIIPLPSKQAFERAYRTARKIGWAIVDQNQAEGRIEATDTTRWFGFKDDIVIRVRPAATGSRVDVRSVSRVGRSDVGTNARRIRKYLKALTEKE